MDYSFGPAGCSRNNLDILFTLFVILKTFEGCKILLLDPWHRSRQFPCVCFDFLGFKRCRCCILAAASCRCKGNTKLANGCALALGPLSRFLMPNDSGKPPGGGLRAGREIGEVSLKIRG